MPSRRVVALILTFWFTTLGIVLYRDVWPLVAASGPPPIAVDLSDEASQFVPVRWKVWRGDQKIGTLTSRMAYRDDDDTFEFTTEYRELRFEMAGATATIPHLTTITCVTRSGSLRRQSMAGQVVLSVPRVGELRGEASVEGRNESGTFVGRCEIESDLGRIRRDLVPVVIRDGPALNPLQPVNRIVNMRPRKRWFVHEIDPLGDALAALFQELLGKQGFGLADNQKEPLLAEVGSRPEMLHWRGEDVSCWVIDYRSGEARAKTWVRVSDGKVLRQEASLLGDRIALEREE